MTLDVFNDLSPTSLLFLVYAVNFALISSYFHHRNLLKKHEDDFKAYIRYFINFFVLLFVIPVVFILFSFSRPFDALESLGLRLGDVKLGTLIILAGIPVSAVLIFISTKNPALKEQYPFSKKACQNPQRLFFYELSYLIFYYTAWEFTFRGVFLFSLIELTGDNSSGIMVAILIQSIVATVYHLGHPHIEVIGALIGSFIFGVIAYATGSILYTVFLHASIGILNDTFIYCRYHKNR